MSGCLGLLAGTLFAADELAADFTTPPDATRPGVWWRWIDGQVTREGITRDLTEMARKGIRSVDVFDVGGGLSAGSAAMMGKTWRDLFQHTLTEASRLGIEVRVVAAAGWGIGGPWGPGWTPHMPPRNWTMRKSRWTDRVAYQKHFPSRRGLNRFTKTLP